ncbi:MAG: hypothetical protein Q7S22_00420 [Candidatus Micrarchaeota archaeon]|nr:hypothetical protein [Candidatus Micrarchaeota archaeon]
MVKLITREESLRRMKAAVEPLKARYGVGAVTGFMKEVLAVNPSVETIAKMSASAEELLKLKPPEEIIAQVTTIIDKSYKNDRLSRFITNLSVTNIGIALMKRNEEYVFALLHALKDLSEINPTLHIAALGKQPFKELLFFSIDGLKKWVEQGKNKFNNSTIAEFCRYVMMCNGYDDVAEFKISENAVFIENVQDELTRFAWFKYDRMLIAVKSRTHVPHVQESDEIRLFLPDHVAYYPDKNDNVLAYFYFLLHEGAHIVKGSFVLDIVAISKYLEERGIIIKEIKFREDTRDLRVKTIILSKDGKDYACTSMFHLMPLLADPGHGRFVGRVNNVLEDLKMDSFWLDEKAPGYRKDYKRTTEHFMFEGGIRKLPDALTASNFYEGLLYITTFLSATEQRREFLGALKTGDCTKLTDEADRRIIGKLRNMNAGVLLLILEFENDLLMLSGARENNCNRTFAATMRVYERVKPLITDPKTNDLGKDGEAIEGMSGPISLTDIDLENIELSFDPEQNGLDVNDLPEDLREKLKKKFDDAFKNLSEEDKTKLAAEADKRLSDTSKRRSVRAGGNTLPGKWNVELVDGVEVKDYITIKEQAVSDSRSKVDALVAANISNTARRIMVTKRRQTTGALTGEVDPLARSEWKADRKRGMQLPRDYHLQTEELRARSVSLYVLGDASGSTAADIGGKRKIDYITGSVHTLIEGVNGVPGIDSAYGFFNSSGREHVHFYPGKAFNGPLRFISVEPNNANRDGAAIRKVGELLSGQNTEVKIALFVNDSMPADDNEYTGKRGVEDVRHAFMQLKKSRILFHVFTTEPDETYYKDQFRSVEDYLDYLYHGRTNYTLIKSEKELDAGFSLFVRTNLPKLRRTVLL